MYENDVMCVVALKIIGTGSQQLICVSNVMTICT